MFNPVKQLKSALVSRVIGFRPYEPQMAAAPAKTCCERFILIFF
jgi:hypothetical protein